MTKLYLIRHAEAEGNLYRIAHGQYDSTITDRGWLQIDALRQRFASIPVDAVYSSDLRRTCLTATAVYVPKKLPLHKRKDLREVLMGCWEQMSWGEIQRENPEQMLNFSRHMERWHVEGSETVAQVQERMVHAIREIAAAHPEQTVAVFSHGMALRILLGTLQGLSLEQISTTPHGDNTAVSLLEAENGQLRVVFRDDNSHVKNISTFAGQTWWKRPNGIEPGLCFDPADPAAQESLLSPWGAEAWRSASMPGSFESTVLLQEARERPCLIASLEGQPVGCLELNPEKEAEQNRGWISFYYMIPEHRCHGYGIQLLGQAVKYYRPLGRNTLRIALSDQAEQARRFFQRYGFAPVGSTDDGRTILEKDIRLPEV